MTHFYAFGSICRGETDAGSDVDLLACVSGPRPEIDPAKFSIYSYHRITELWEEGNPFAWHLHLESRLLYSSDGLDFIVSLTSPSPYRASAADCSKFRQLFADSYDAMLTQTNSMVFHLSCMFLAMRNFATCYSFSAGRPIFSRSSPLLIDRKIPIAGAVFDIFARARILATRGYGPSLSSSEIATATQSAPEVIDWMNAFAV